MDPIELVGKIPDIISGVTSSDTISLIFKLVLVVLLIGVLIWASIWLEKKKREKAQADTQQEHTDAQTGIVQENHDIAHDAHQAESEVQDLLGKK